jgi:ATP-binding cassette subfamily C protein CydD
MDHGQLVEQGTLEELKQKNGAFMRLSQALRGEKG